MDYGALYIPRKPQRRTLNIVPIFVSLFVPWLFFTLLSTMLTFSFHYNNPRPTYAIMGASLLFILMLGALALDALRKQSLDDDEPHDAVWHSFTASTGLLAFVLAIMLGDWNFYTNMQVFYDIVNLNSYSEIDPSRSQGQELMDAGRIVFTQTSRLDLRRAISFKNLQLYCAAPITLTNGIDAGSGNASLAELASYDFWAVGMDCCSGSGLDFSCGEAHNPKAHGGLRVLDDKQRPFFRLAVQQAEATYGIRSVHPIFLHWQEDPTSGVRGYQDEGYKYELIGMLGHFLLQLLLVACATSQLAKRARN